MHFTPQKTLLFPQYRSINLEWSSFLVHYAYENFFPSLKGDQRRGLKTHHDKEARSEYVRDEYERYDNGQAQTRSHTEKVLSAEIESMSGISKGSQKNDCHQKSLERKKV